MVKNKDRGKSTEKFINLMDVQEQEQHSEELTIRLFGPMEVRIGGEPLPALRTRKGLYVLALLALRHGRSVDRAWVAESLWPESGPAEALANLRRTLTDLRRALGPQAGRIEAPTQNTLRFDAEGADVDVITFDTGIAGKSDGGREAAVAARFRGTLLEGCYEEWALAEQQWREEAYETARTTLADSAMGRGDYAAAARHYKALTVLDPLRESAWRGWMQALAGSGDARAALDVYRRLRETLRRETGATEAAAPEPETAALYQELRALLESSALPDSPEAPGIVDDSFASPPPAASAASAAAVAAVAAPTGWLPAPATAFVGRVEVSEELTALVREERMVTVLGAGGTGKTRLSLRVGEMLRPHFEDGVWFCDFAPVSDPSLVPAAIARLFAVREVPGETLLDTVACHLTGRRVLLILDNCEHLIDACAAAASRLLSASAELRLLATSRRVLGVYGEAAYRLRSLPESEASELFARRARAASPRFALTAENTPMVAELCRRLDGIPLAIELAAARMGALSLPEITARLEDRFLLLTGGGRDAPDRHRTLRGALDWSWDLLAASERDLLCRLSLFPGGATLPAVRAVAFSEDTSEYAVLDALENLLAHSLLFQDGDGRWRMLETVRQYALDRIDAETLRGAGTRQVEWLLTLALPHYKEQTLWLDTLDAERDNLRAALDFVEGLPERLEAGLLLAYWLCTFFIVRGDITEAQRRYADLLDKMADDDPERAGLLASAGRIAHALGDSREARRRFEAALRIPANPKETAATLSNLGRLALEGGNLDEARDLFTRSLTAWEHLEDEEQVAGKRIMLGRIGYLQGRMTEARQAMQEGVAYYRAIDNKLGLASALKYLAAIDRDEGRLDDERACCEEMLFLHQQTGDKRGAADAHLLLAECAVAQFQQRGGAGTSPPAAVRRHGEMAVTLLREAGDLHDAALALLRLGDLLLKLDAPADAAAAYRRALTLSLSANGAESVFRSLTGLAQSAVREERWENAAHLLGCAEAWSDFRGGFTPSADDAASFEQVRAAARAALGEEAAAEAWAFGRAMTPEEAARESSPPPSGHEPSLPS